VVGAVTQPWKAEVVFRALPPEEFAAFAEPGYVKIAWTLRADPISATHSVFRTETRVAATDAPARAKFRLYWSVFSPGMALIRLALLRPLKRDAEHVNDTPAARRSGGRLNNRAPAHVPSLQARIYLVDPIERRRFDRD